MTTRDKRIIMSHINKSGNSCMQMNLSYLSTFFRSPKPRSWFLASTLIILVIMFHRDTESLDLLTPESDIVDIPTTTTAIDSPEVVLEMNDQIPAFKLATKTGEKPSSDGDRAQAKLIEELHLQETCKQDPSTIVVDVGAGLGEFGLYAAACGCTVYLFEIRSELITLIQSSINHNSFASPPVTVLHNAVSDLPSDTTFKYVPLDSVTNNADNPILIQTIRLDDVSWSSSSIYLLKIDAEGSELNVLRSAKNLFDAKRIRHVMFKYSPWLGEQALQKTLLTYARRDLRAKFMYTLYRTDENIYGPIMPMHFSGLYDQLSQSRTETIIYAALDTKSARSSITAKPFQLNKP